MTPAPRLTRRASRLRGPALAFGLALICAATATAGALEAGRPAPPLRAALIDGGSFDLERERGRVVVINYWATWCPPCRKEMPALDALYRKHRAYGLTVLAISLDDPDQLPAVRAAVAPYAFATALAARTHADQYGPPRRVPLTYVVGRDGVLRVDGRKGAPVLDLPMLERMVLPLLERAAH